MTEESGRTLVCSVLFVDLIGYSKKAVAEQHQIKQLFNRELAEALDLLKRVDRIIVDTGDGAAVVFLGDPEDAMIVGLAMRETAAKLPMRLGINLGPVRMITDLNGQTNVIGDGINVAQRVMGFADAGQLLVSANYHDVVTRVSEHYGKLFTRAGKRHDKHVREHDVYMVDGAVRINEPLLDDAPAPAAAPAQPEAPAKVHDTGPSLMISGGSRASVEAMVKSLVAQGARVMSEPSMVAGKWFVTCSHPSKDQSECAVENIGHKRMVSGPTRQAVADKVKDLTSFGATLVGEIEEVDGRWIAICDTEH
jgi:class 3 adenylate cyclase